MKIVIDMNLSPLWVETFTEAGIESVHWSTIGLPYATDRTIMTWAIDNNYIVFTNDLDFGILLATTGAKLPSVIQLRSQDILPNTMGKLVISTLRQLETQIKQGVLITINSSNYRVRILPIYPLQNN